MWSNSKRKWCLIVNPRLTTIQTKTLVAFVFDCNRHILICKLHLTWMFHHPCYRTKNKCDFRGEQLLNKRLTFCWSWFLIVSISLALISLLSYWNIVSANYLAYSTCNNYGIKLWFPTEIFLYVSFLSHQLIIHLSVGKSGEYLPHRFAARQVSTIIHLHFDE